MSFRLIAYLFSWFNRRSLRGVALTDRFYSARLIWGGYQWSGENQWTNFRSRLWNGIMELRDMPYRSTICRISRLWTSDLMKVIVILRSSKCDPKKGLPKICVGNVFIWEVAHLGKKWPEGYQTKLTITRRLCPNGMGTWSVLFKTTPSCGLE